jgi:prohibitin 1
MILLVLLVVGARSLRVIPAGHVGVVDLFGRVAPETLKSGIQIVNPFARVTTLSVKTQELKEVMDVPSKEGLSMQVEVSVLFHLDPEKASDVYRTIGQDYIGVILEPQFRSVTRGVTAAYEAKALYTSEREHLAQLVTTDLRVLVAPRGITIESTPLRKLTLPPRITTAIEEKLSADQESQRMEFVLLKEKQEAERKRIEATGVADFQRIVATGISPELLRWKGIEATTKIAESPNAKVIVIGSGKEGLPIILGGQ